MTPEEISDEMVRAGADAGMAELLKIIGNKLYRFDITQYPLSIGNYRLVRAILIGALTEPGDKPAPALPAKLVKELANARAMDQWEASTKRPDMEEKDRIRGALSAYADAITALGMEIPE